MCCNLVMAWPMRLSAAPYKAPLMGPQPKPQKPKPCARATPKPWGRLAHSPAKSIPWYWAARTICLPKTIYKHCWGQPYAWWPLVRQWHAKPGICCRQQAVYATHPRRWHQMRPYSFTPPALWPPCKQRRRAGCNCPPAVATPWPCHTIKAVLLGRSATGVARLALGVSGTSVHPAHTGGRRAPCVHTIGKTPCCAHAHADGRGAVV